MDEAIGSPPPPSRIRRIANLTKERTGQGVSVLRRTGSKVAETAQGARDAVVEKGKVVVGAVVERAGDIRQGAAERAGAVKEKSAEALDAARQFYTDVGKGERILLENSQAVELFIQQLQITGSPEELTARIQTLLADPLGCYFIAHYLRDTATKPLERPAAAVGTALKTAIAVKITPFGARILEGLVKAAVKKIGGKTPLAYPKLKEACMLYVTQNGKLDMSRINDLQTIVEAALTQHTTTLANTRINTPKA